MSVVRRGNVQRKKARKECPHCGSSDVRIVSFFRGGGMLWFCFGCERSKMPYTHEFRTMDEWLIDALVKELAHE